MYVHLLGGVSVGRLLNNAPCLLSRLGRGLGQLLLLPEEQLLAEGLRVAEAILAEKRLFCFDSITAPR